jgi:hypothetical protein
MSRTALIIAGTLFLIGAVLSGIVTNWILVFCALTLGLGCIAGAFLIQVDNPVEDPAAEAPAA